MAAPTYYDEPYMDAYRLVAIAKNLSYTGLLGAGMVASALHPENSMTVAAMGAVLLIPTINAVKNWCEQMGKREGLEEKMAAFKASVKKAASHWGPETLAVIGVVAIAASALSVHIAGPDYDYSYLKTNTTATRLADPEVNQKFFDKDYPLNSAQRTIEYLESSTQANAQEKIEVLKKASVDYLRASYANQNSAEYKNLFNSGESTAIGAAPYLRSEVPTTLAAQYTGQALANIQDIARTSNHEVMGRTKTSYVQSLIQLCRYANNAETKAEVNASWSAMAAKVIVNRSQKTHTTSAFQKDIKADVSEACSDYDFMP